MPTDKGVVEMSVNEKTGKVSSSITTYEKYGQAPNLPEAEQKEMYQQAKEQLRSLRKEGNSSELEEVRKRLEEAKRTYQEGVSTKSSEVVEQKSSVKKTTINIKQSGGREMYLHSLWSYLIDKTNKVLVYKWIIISSLH